MILLMLCFYGCSAGEKIEITNSEIVSASAAQNIKFTVRNNLKTTLKELTLNAVLLDADGNEIESCRAEYPIEVKSGESATLSIKSEKSFDTAKAVSCSYIDADGGQVTYKFKKEYIAVHEDTTTAEKLIRTRADLAEEIIQDVKFQFLKKKYATDGAYDAEKNQLMIATYCDLTLNECIASYRINPDQWDELAQSITTMSQTCVDEFADYGFDDVHVSIGFMSKDEQIVLSATDGEIVDSLS